MTLQAPDSSATLPAPAVARLSAIATHAPPSATRDYRPNSSDYALAGALFSSNPETFSDLAAAAGLSESTIGRVVADPARAAWILDRAAKTATVGLALAYRVLLERALTSKSSAWMKLLLQRFDKVFAAANGPPTTSVNNQYNFVAGLSDAELKAMAGQLTRRTLGCQTPTPPPPAASSP